MHSRLRIIVHGQAARVCKRFTSEECVPFTMVLGPDGSVIYREAGEVHLLDLRRAILAHLPDMGYVGNAAYWASKTE
jgi:hypothetical protein